MNHTKAKKWPSLLAGSVWALLVAPPCLAQLTESCFDGNPDKEALCDDWGGHRSTWRDQGIETELLVKGTLLTNPTGGIKRGADYMQNLEVKLKLDTTKLLEIADSSAFLHLVINSGGKMNAAYVGSLMGVDNSEARENDAKLYQAWFNQRFWNSALSVLAGVYPVDSEFYVTDSSGIFIHPSFGMAAELAQTGRNGPSIYPLSALGMRVLYQPAPAIYIQTALVDGNPGDGHHPHWSRISPKHGDGALFMAEIGYHPAEAHHAIVESESETERYNIQTPSQRLEERYESIGKYALGYWSYTAKFEDLTDTDAQGNPLQRRNSGLYALLERTIYRAEDMARDLAIFVRHGRANENINVFDRSTSIGLRLRGMVTGRADDTFGLAATRAHASKKYQLTQSVAGIDSPTAETAIEATYRAQLRPWLTVQPFAQRILNPGLSPDIKDATILGVRFEISL